MKTKIDTEVKANVSLVDGPNLGPMGVVICSATLGACEFEHRFKVCKHLLCPVLLGSDFAQEFRIGINCNNQGQLYLHQDHKLLIYSRVSYTKDLAIYSVACNEASETNVLLATWTIVVVPAESNNIMGTKPDKFANVIANSFCI